MGKATASLGPAGVHRKCVWASTFLHYLYHVLSRSPLFLRLNSHSQEVLAQTPVFPVVSDVFVCLSLKSGKELTCVLKQ